MPLSRAQDQPLPLRLDDAEPAAQSSPAPRGTTACTRTRPPGRPAIAANASCTLDVGAEGVAHKIRKHSRHFLARAAERTAVTPLCLLLAHRRWRDALESWATHSRVHFRHSPSPSRTPASSFIFLHAPPPSRADACEAANGAKARDDGHEEEKGELFIDAYGGGGFDRSLPEPPRSSRVETSRRRDKEEQ